MMRNSNITKKIKSFKVMVIGDLMLDIYIQGQVKRISPEAPVPVVIVKDNYYLPGGAANVAVNLKRLGVNTELYGVIGRDHEGDKLLTSLKEQKIKTNGIIRIDDRPTTTKTRILAESQQIVRCDNERTSNIKNSTREIIFSKILKSYNKHKPDAIILSDYNKGTISKEFISAILKINKKEKALILADPKGNNPDKYTGVDVITPNTSEVKDLTKIDITGNKSFNKATSYLINKCRLSAIVVTRGKYGISYKLKGSRINNISSQARDVYDVTGAGDTVISTLILAYLLTHDWKFSVTVANCCAGIVVSRIGTSNISQKEFIDLFESDARKNIKEISLELLKSEVLKHKQKNNKIVFTNGCFDILHPGHIELLKKAKSLGDILVVGLNSDSSVKRLKGKSRPLIKEKQRSNIISLLDVVDYVTIFKDDTPIKVIEQIMPDIIVKGGDYSPDKVVGKKFVESYGGCICIVPLHSNYSTTAIMDSMKNKL